MIGIDVDDAIKQNPSLDESYLIQNGHFPLLDASVDVAFADWVLQHIENPASFSSEVHRSLKSGGWFCARTPNKWGYISTAARLVPTRIHSVVLRRAQPDRKSDDVFPTFYRLNTFGDIYTGFPKEKWDVVVYTHEAEPAYFGNNADYGGSLA